MLSALTLVRLAAFARGNGMIQGNFQNNQRVDKIFKYSQFQEIVKAIILGKYSWACVLFLQFSGCDPLEYIPAETYQKLVADNSNCCQDGAHTNNQQGLNKQIKIPGLKFIWRL
jgi:hypothetical protein